MPNPWYPRAVRDRGAAAGYTRGRNRTRSVKCHYTVGRDSWALIRDEGLAQWLVTRDGTVAQFAECDALCYDSGEWNDDGPGIEIEYYDEPDIFTDEARDATAALVHWLHDEWKFPLDYYDGDRLPEGTWQGFIAHRSLQQSQPHSDYWPRADWDRMVTAAPSPVPYESEGSMFFLKSPSGVRLMMGPIFTGVSQRQYEQLRDQGVPEFDVSNDGQDGENLANTLMAWSNRELEDL